MTECTTIAVLTDTHYGAASEGSDRRCDIGDILLQRAVLRLNRLIKPDITVVLGDLVDDGDAGRAHDDLQRMRGILDLLDSPYIAIPGNHDGDPEKFFKVFERPDPFVDMAGVRFLPFVDKGEPKWWASRRESDLARMREARSGCNGPIVSLQHVCLHDPKRGNVPPYYNYTNAEEVIRAMKDAGIALSISGHHHAGAEDSWVDNIMFVNAPGLCEAPFPFVVVTIDGDTIETHRHELVMSAAAELIDSHVHTQLAYCAENMDVEKSIALAKDFGLAGVTFTEHSGQLYFDRKPYWRNVWLDGGLAAAEEKYNRMPDYLELKAAFESDFAKFSLEVECDARGDLLLKREDAGRFQNLLGTIHAVPALGNEDPPTDKDAAEFLRLVESLCKSGVKALAHPLRVFGRLGWDVPEVLYESTADVLATHGVAAELNFHSSHRPSVRFVKACLERGVKFTFGSDSHNLAEIGDFAYQLDILDKAGYKGDLADVLWQAD